jgi:hypothetical protein
LPFAVLGLDGLPATDDEVQRLVPAAALQGAALAAAAQHRVAQAIRVADLLVGDHPLGAQMALVVREVARLDAGHLAVGDPQIHAALHAAEGAVGRHQRFGQTICLRPADRWRAALLKIVIEVPPGKDVFVDAHRKRFPISW